MAESLKTSRVAGHLVASDALTATTKVVDGPGLPLPATVTLRSADATRKIEVSTDGGVEYFVPTYDYISATELMVVLEAPVSHVRFTGAINDTWSIR